MVKNFITIEKNNSIIDIYLKQNSEKNRVYKYSVMIQQYNGNELLSEKIEFFSRKKDALKYMTQEKKRVAA